MLSGCSLRFSWICLLMFSTASCFPATKGDYKYPYTWRFGPAAGSDPQPQGPRRPLASLQHEAGPGNQSPSGMEAPSAGSSPSYEPNGFLLSSNKPAKAPKVSPQSSRYNGGPAGTSGSSQMGPVSPQSSRYNGVPAGTSGSSQMGPVSPQSSRYNGVPAGTSGSSKMGPVSPQSSRYNGVPAGTSGSSQMGPVHQLPALYSGGAAVSSVSDPGSVRFEEAGSSHAGAPASYSLGYGYYSSSGPESSWEEQPAGGAGDALPDLSAWLESRNFPDFSVWESSQGAPQGAGVMPPLPPPSYIIQSSNNFLRARELVSHSLYSPEYPNPVVYDPPAADTSKSPAAPGSKGGKKVN